MSAEHFSLGGDDHVGCFATHLVLDNRYGHLGHVAAEGLEASEECSLHRTKKARDALDIEDVDELIRSPRGLVGSKRLVGQCRQRNLVTRIVNHPIEFGLLLAFLRCLQFLRAGLQCTSDMKCLLNGRGLVAVGISFELAQQVSCRQINVGGGHGIL